MNIFKKIIAKLTGSSFEVMPPPEKHERDEMTRIRTEHPEPPPTTEQKFKAQSELERQLAEERRRNAEQRRAQGPKERTQ